MENIEAAAGGDQFHILDSEDVVDYTNLEYHRTENVRLTNGINLKDLRSDGIVFSPEFEDNVFAEESLPTSLSWPEKPDWVEGLKGKSKLMFNWWPEASCAFVKLDTGASWWSQAARAESGFGGAGAYQNTSVVQSTSTFSRVPPPEAWMVRLAAASPC